MFLWRFFRLRTEASFNKIFRPNTSEPVSSKLHVRTCCSLRYLSRPYKYVSMMSSPPANQHRVLQRPPSNQNAALWAVRVTGILLIGADGSKGSMLIGRRCCVMPLPPSNRHPASAARSNQNAALGAVRTSASLVSGSFQCWRESRLGLDNRTPYPVLKTP